MRHLLPLVALLLASPAGAWESECRPEATAATFGGRNNEPTQSICADADTPRCEQGPLAARGVQMGEHSYLARRFLAMAGLGTYRTKAFLTYWGAGDTIPLDGGGTTERFAPAHVDGIGAKVTRPTVLPELANVPDFSHTLSDWVLGNEHCFVPELPKGTAKRNAACHTFNPHMGAVNSTHFLPQAQVMYRQYHQSAMRIAQRCKQLDDALAATDLALADDVGPDAVEACELEALAFEAYASHYLADAWASGHMWQRWGVPSASSSNQIRMNQSAVAIVSGLIHGWRSVARDLPLVGSSELVHDQMCMAGPFDDDGPYVTYSQQGLLDLPAAGGDLYLLQCNAYEEDREWAVSTGSKLAPQWNRMQACGAAGFAEVYDAGPRTEGDRSAPTSPDAEITSSLHPSCWSQRVTNSAFVQGMGLSDQLTLADPGRVVRLVLGVILGDQQSGLEDLGVTDDDLERTRRHLRADLARMALHAKRRAKRLPNGNDLANLDHANMFTLLGFRRNGEYTTSTAFRPAQPYMDLSHGVWSDFSNTGCSTDTECAAGQPGTYCDLTSEGGGTCRRPEAALLRAFRTAELAHHCNTTRYSDIDDLREGCTAALGTGPACDACVEIVLPHLRNGCDAESMRLLEDDSGYERGSLCDQLSGLASDGAPVYGVYDPTSAADARAEARAFCTTDDAERPTQPTRWFWEPSVTPLSLTLDSTTTSGTVDVTASAQGQEIDWTVEVAGTGVTVSPETFTAYSGNTTMVDVTATDATTPRFVDVEVHNECAPSVRAAAQLRIGSGFTHVPFDDFSSVQAAASDTWAADGITVTSSAMLMGLPGDDSLGQSAICGSSDGLACDSDVLITFDDPVSSVSFYVGDQDRDFEGYFGIAVSDTNGQALDVVQSRFDRRFYSFTASGIGSVALQASSEWELLDELWFVSEVPPP